MSIQERQGSGRFALKSSTHRLVRSIRLTDKTWDLLGDIANTRSITRADLLENIVDWDKLKSLSTGQEIDQLAKQPSEEINKDLIEKLKQRSLLKMKMGVQAANYKIAKKAIDFFIEELLLALKSM